jgi:DNA-directed RNA polymerase subunit RPC12/RpoP
MYLARVEKERRKLEVVCRSCRVRLLVKARYAGRRVPCAVCRAPVLVPTEEDEDTASFDVRPLRPAPVSGAAGQKMTGSSIAAGAPKPARTAAIAAITVVLAFVVHFSFSSGSRPGTAVGGGRGAPPLRR